MLHHCCVQGVFVLSIISYSELDYKRPGAPLYVYPQWAVGVGWATAALSAIFIPIVAIYNALKFRSSGKVSLSIAHPLKISNSLFEFRIDLEVFIKVGLVCYENAPQSYFKSVHMNL